MNIRSVSPATVRRAPPPPPPPPCRDLATEDHDGRQRPGYDHGGYISPFVKAFLEYLLFSAGDTFAIVVAFFRYCCSFVNFCRPPVEPPML